MGAKDFRSRMPDLLALCGCYDMSWSTFLDAHVMADKPRKKPNHDELTL